MLGFLLLIWVIGVLCLLAWCLWVCGASAVYSRLCVVVVCVLVWGCSCWWVVLSFCATGVSFVAVTVDARRARVLGFLWLARGAASLAGWRRWCGCWFCLTVLGVRRYARAAVKNILVTHKACHSRRGGHRSVEPVPY